MRVAQKYPCMVLHIGYIEGTPHHLQSDTLALLRSNWPHPPRKGVGPRLPRRSLLCRLVRTEEWPPPALATIVGKQLQRVMIRWVWSMFRHMCMSCYCRYDSIQSAASSSLSLSGVGPGASAEATEKLTQMEYLHCYSWQWQPPTPTPAILSALLE